MSTNKKIAVAFGMVEVMNEVTFAVEDIEKAKEIIKKLQNLTDFIIKDE